MIFDNNIAYQTSRILISIFGTLGMVVTISRIKENKMKNLLIVCGYAFYTIVFCYLCIHHFGFLFFLCSAIFTISIPGVVITYLIADTTLSKHIFCCLSQLLLSLYLIVSVTLLNTLLSGSTRINVFLLLLAYLAMILLECIFFRNAFLYFADTVTGSCWILAPIPCSFFLFGMAVIIYPEHYTQNASFFIPFALSGAVLLIVYYAIFQYLRLQYQYRMEDQNRALLKLQIENIRKQAKDTERKAEAVKNARRDIRQMLSAVALLAKEGNTEAILDYIEEASVQSAKATPARYCNDPIVNATLTTYFSRAERSGIQVEQRLSFPETLPVDSAELSICFANALENAIHACEKLPENERKIVIRCIHKPQFMFEIENPYHGQISFGRNGLPKPHESNHGIGTRSIMAFCEKHNAFYSFSAQSGWFKLVITL
ncbi:MAG: ATP-binding protein [Bulleidia sp.]